MKKPHAYITNRHLTHPVLNRIITGAAAIFAVVTLLLSGVPRAYAATATDTYSPASQTVSTGSNFTVTVNTNAGLNHVLTDQLRVTFNPAKLEYVSVSYSGSPLTTDAPDAGAGSGYFQISRYTLGAQPTGTFLLATLTFRALATSGSDTLGYDPANSSIYVNEDGGAANALTGVSGATYSFDGVNPTASVTTPANGSTISGSAVAFSANATDAGGVTKVEFSIDGTVIATDTSSPYSTSLNSTAYTNGVHALAAKAYDGVGRTATSSVSATISNGTSGGGSTSTPTPTTSGGSTTTSGDTPTTNSDPASQPLAEETGPIALGNGVESNGSEYTVASLADQKINKSSTSLFAIIGISVAGVAAIAGGVVLRNILLRKRAVMRHIAVGASETVTSPEPLFEHGQAPIAPSNLPYGTVVHPTTSPVETQAPAQDKPTIIQPHRPIE